jgi:hypothetical protein
MRQRVDEPRAAGWFAGIGGGPLVVAALLLAGGVALHSVALYSDIPALYARDHLAGHPVPYFGYPLEYPVGMGLVIWLLGFVHGARAYFLATAAVLAVAGALTVRLGRAIPGANLWILALSPALLLYTALNWDMLAILLLVGAFILLGRGRDRWGALLLAGAVWTKFFPIVVVPLVVLDRLLRRRWRDALEFAGVFAAASVAMNAPVAFQWTPAGPRLRESWLWFFRFNQQRPREANLWTLLDPSGLRLTTAQINAWSAALLLAGLAAAAALLVVAWRRGAGRDGAALLAAALVALGWWFFINKVYSPQYSLWLVVLLALLAAPPLLAAVFAVADLAYFGAILVAVAERTWAGWVGAPVLLAPTAVREAVILAIVAWAAWRVVRVPRAREATARSALVEVRA